MVACVKRQRVIEWSSEVLFHRNWYKPTTRSACERTFFRLGFPRSLRDLRKPLVAKIYAKKAASADFVRSGSEPLASLADACRSLSALY